MNLLNPPSFLSIESQRWDLTMIIIESQKLKSRILSALSDSSMHTILQSTSLTDKSANDIIRMQGLPHSTTYRKINELIKCGLLVLYRSEITQEDCILQKHISLDKSNL